MRESGVEWRDLVVLTRREILVELTLPLPWLLAAIMAGQSGHSGWVVFATLVMFMMGLRITHNAFHRNLGISRSAGDLVMFALSVLLGGAMHAIEFTHLRHHRDSLADDDIEGHIAHLGFFSAVLHSPIYPLQIHWVAMRNGSLRQKRWIAIELAAVALLHAVIWLGDSSALKLMALSLYFANASAPLVGIWAVHRGCATGHFRARTSRSTLLNALTVSLFNHLEHHLYPAVPTCHLPTLARRLDAHWQGEVSPPDILEWRQTKTSPGTAPACRAKRAFRQPVPHIAPRQRDALF